MVKKACIECFIEDSYEILKKKISARKKKGSKPLRKRVSVLVN